MSAEQLGRRLLEEVEEGSLDELLSEIKASAAGAQWTHLGIPSLAQILELVRRPQLPPLRPAWAAPQVSSDNDEDYHDDRNTPSRPQTWTPRHPKKPAARSIQLTSTSSAAGKTSLLYYLSAFSILAKCWGGSEAVVVWLDTDGRFSSLRLAQIYARVLQSYSSDASKVELDAQVRHGLSHVHVFRPQSSAQLIATSRTLSDYLLSRDRHHSQRRPLGLVVLDSATAFYWADRADTEVARLSNPSTPTPPSTASQVISHLKDIENTFDCTVIFTTNASLLPKNRAQLESSARTVADSPVPPRNEQALQDPWTSFATVTLDVKRQPVPQFAPSMTMEECVRDQPRRVDAIRRGRHRAQIVWTGNENNEIRDGVRKLQIGEGFDFRVTAQGVEVESPNHHQV